MINTVMLNKIGEKRINYSVTGLTEEEGDKHGNIVAMALKLSSEDKLGEFSDGYHTFNELYDFRKAYNALIFNEWSSQDKYGVHKSWRHSDGELCFGGGGWFVVSAQTPTGQITNHYKDTDWDLFKCEVRDKAEEWDGHTPQEALTRLLELAKKG